MQAQQRQEVTVSCHGYAVTEQQCCQVDDSKKNGILFVESKCILYWSKFKKIIII